MYFKSYNCKTADWNVVKEKYDVSNRVQKLCVQTSHFSEFTQPWDIFKGNKWQKFVLHITFQCLKNGLTDRDL